MKWISGWSAVSGEDELSEGIRIVGPSGIYVCGLLSCLVYTQDAAHGLRDFTPLAGSLSNNTREGDSQVCDPLDR